MTEPAQACALTIGAYGWNDPAWLTDFYPEDLPASWRLAYYANEFSCVLVPTAYWHEAPAFDPAQCYEDVNDTFRFYLEIDAGLAAAGDWASFVRTAAALGEKLAGGIVTLAPAQQGALRSAWSERFTATPLYTLGLGETDEPVSVWQGAHTPCPCAPLAWVQPGPRPTPMAMRHLLEAFAHCVGGGPSDLLIQGDAQTLYDARTLAGLMGLY